MRKLTTLGWILVAAVVAAGGWAVYATLAARSSSAPMTRPGTKPKSPGAGGGWGGWPGWADDAISAGSSLLFGWLGNRRDTRNEGNAMTRDAANAGQG